MSSELVKKYVSRYLNGYASVITRLADEKQLTNLIYLLELIVKRRGTHPGRVFIAGNGGSASNASHFSMDVSKSSSDGSGHAYHVISLTDNTPHITAIGNDYGFDVIFSNQMKRFQPTSDDALIVLSVSGKSPNIVDVVDAAVEKGMTVCCLTGAFGYVGEGRYESRVLAGKFATIKVPSTDYGGVEDAHMCILHLIIALLQHDIQSRTE